MENKTKRIPLTREQKLLYGFAVVVGLTVINTLVVLVMLKILNVI